MKPYNSDTCLIDMLMSQLEFQRKLLKKRNIIAPDAVSASANMKLEEACYHATCTNVEFAEFIEQLDIDKNELTNKVLLELTDAFTFLLNQLLYINVLPTKTLEYYRSAAEQKMKDCKADSYAELIGEYNLAIGALYRKTRYKTWKMYVELNDNIYALIPLIDDTLISFMMFYVKAGITSDKIYSLFYQKHEINIERQNVGGKYEAV